MRRWWKRLVGAILALAVAAPAFGAATWIVVTDQDCTGFAAATGITSASVPCCKASATAGGNICNKIEWIGDMKVRPIVLVTGAAQTYTNPGGDALNTTAIQRAGFTGGVYFATCQGTSGGNDVNWIPQAPGAGATWGAKIQLFTTGAGLAATGLAGNGETANTTAIANTSIQCLVFGY
jgi:hypothetical protein